MARTNFKCVKKAISTSTTTTTTKTNNDNDNAVPSRRLSHASWQDRLESSTRRRSSDDVITDSPYAAESRGSKNTDNIPTNSNSSSTSSNNAGWKHKHTKTLPWGEGGEAIGAGAGGGGGRSSSTRDVRREKEEGFARPAVDRLARNDTKGNRGGRAREGYRFQVHISWFSRLPAEVDLHKSYSRWITCRLGVLYSIDGLGWDGGGGVSGDAGLDRTSASDVKG